MFVLYKAGEDGRQMVTFEGSPKISNWVDFLKEHRVYVSPQEAMEKMMEMEVETELCIVCFTHAEAG
ncbi:uncharacterized protein [Blastocystis hominis]|uniref:Uncharacterized protein n=1 Tax=Blastocystis hominis TaxID=12968 RepID=D8LZX8_BLAHO|nr:uncharacterized protein [Blastocystis hominis]CBK21367.2 unnamed protein product [Blastocystis hominis]|eukprot:XP_012895415.1 uncharacterized protein [Blastocystis hominis]